MRRDARRRYVQSRPELPGAANLLRDEGFPETRRKRRPVLRIGLPKASQSKSRSHYAARRSTTRWINGFSLNGGKT